MDVWTEDDIQYLREFSGQKTAREIGNHLGKHEKSVTQKRYQLKLPCSRPAWTAEDEAYLMDKWGTLSTPAIAKHLGRSVNAVKIRAARLGLGPSLMGGGYISLNQLIIAVSGNKTTYGYKMTSWVENRGLPVHTKKVEKNSFRVVYLDEFWEWAENNRSFIDFSKMEPLALGVEPAWVQGQRKRDFTAFSIQRKDPWTSAEDSRLTGLLKQHRYGYAQLSELLHRSAGAIQRRCNDLGLKERPVKADNRNEWTEADFSIVADGIRAGDSYTMIGLALGRSEKAVRGKIYYTYLTENADKVRNMMGDGEYGAGAPVPTVKQAIRLSRTRTDTAKLLTKLDAVLRYRLDQLGYEPYWQKAMCVHWHDIKGCTAGETDCDSCVGFERIKPQYCTRCGATIMRREREKWPYCDRCKVARKKDQQQKWRRLHGIGGVERVETNT